MADGLCDFSVKWKLLSFLSQISNLCFGGLRANLADPKYILRDIF